MKIPKQKRVTRWGVLFDGELCSTIGDTKQDAENIAYNYGYRAGKKRIVRMTIIWDGKGK